MKEGKDYEQFVAKLQQAILVTAAYTQNKNIQVETKKKIIDRNGIEREFDVYWEYELGGFLYKSVIECKDYASKVSIEKIDALLGKIQDLPDINKAIFATKKGYQSGARIKAEQNNIDLLIVREQNDSDWKDSDGTSLLKIVDISGILRFQPIIHYFELFFDTIWIKNNTDIDIIKNPSIDFSALPTEIFIEDLKSDEKHTLLELTNKLISNDPQKFGAVEYIEYHLDAFIYYQDKKLKITGYKINYTLSKPIEVKMYCDAGDEFIGVIEYISKCKKSEIMKNGKTRESIINKK